MRVLLVSWNRAGRGSIEAKGGAASYDSLRCWPYSRDFDAAGGGAVR